VTGERLASDSSVELSATTSETHVVPPPVLDRTMGTCGRLGVELQLLGLLSLAWLLVSLHGATWLMLSRTADAVSLNDLGRVLVPQFMALAGLSMRTLVELPAARWDRTGSFTTRRHPWAFTLIGWVMAPVAFVLWRRDRAARRTFPAPEAMIGAHTRLLRLPYWTALRLLAWSTTGFAVSAVWLATARPSMTAIDLTLALVWIGAVAPIAVALAGAMRRALRPEVITVPTTIPARRVYDVSVRLQLLMSFAGIGGLLTLTAGGSLLAFAERDRSAIDDATARATSLLAVIAQGDELALGQLLARAPDVTVELGPRRFGPARWIGPQPAGPLDLDDDGIVDGVVAGRDPVQVIVPLGPRPPVRTLPVALVGLLAILAATVAGVALGRDTQRDILRAHSQVGAVAEGRAPPALAMQALSTAEIRRLVQSVDRLVARITESNVEKYVAIEKSKEADRLKSQFLANMSHDLRSPLNSILGFSELLLSGIDGPLTDEQRDMVAVIHSSGGELLQQIDDILDAAKLDAGRLELHPEPSPPATLVNRAVVNAKRRLGPGISFDVDTSSTLPPAFVDPYRTVQALENVLSFAAVRVERGVITVRAQLATSGRRRMIVVEIRPPVAPASAEQLGSARRGFHRLPGHRGLGLLLPIAGAILELQGGTLSIRESTRGTKPTGAHGSAAAPAVATPGEPPTTRMVFRVELRALELRRGTDPQRSPTRGTPGSSHGST
jgi:signal transduction histidine kinase